MRCGYLLRKYGLISTFRDVLRSITAVDGLLVYFSIDYVSEFCLLFFLLMIFLRACSVIDDPHVI